VLMTTHSRRISSIAAGLLLPLAFAPFNLFWLAPVSLAVLFFLWEEQSPREAAIVGSFYGIGVFTLGTYWLYISLRQLGGAPIPVVILLMSALVLAMSAYTALAGWLAARIRTKSGPLQWLVVLPAAWVLVEWFRGWFLTGFPWLSIGYSQVDTPVAGWAPILGVHGVSWVVALLAGLGVMFLRGGSRLGQLFAVVAGIVIAGLSMQLQSITWTQPRAEPLRVALVQAAIPQEVKWSPAQLQPTLSYYRDTTLALESPDLVIWPEAAIPALPFEVPDFLDDMNEVMSEQGTQLYSGILTFNLVTGEFRNTLMGIGGYQGSYDKRHLVPFGEYFPVPKFVSNWLRLMNLPSEDVTAGPPLQSTLQVNGIPVAPTICYEVAFGAEQLQFFPDAELMINISNDTWFGDSIAPHQHLQMARMRSLETGRPMLRSTNTGITAIIGANGRILDRIPQFIPGVLTAKVYPHTGITPYIRWGNYPVVCFAFLLLGVAGLRRRASV
jgi:apolipoprotein N-acyltransferase